MPGTAKGQTLFDLSGGHPALDLVNSLDNRFRHDGPNEILVGYGELLRFLGESELLDTRQIRLLSKGASGARGGAGVALSERVAGSGGGSILRRLRTTSSSAR